MNVLSIWDETQGKYVPIPAIKGDKGDTGSTGPQGPQGDTGPQGPAYTLTEADKETIVAAVLAALPDGTEVAY